MKVIIIGGVAAGASAAARLRRLDENAEIILLEKGNLISYANCGLPYHLGRVIPDREDLLVMTAEKFKSWFRVDVRTGSEAIKIDRAGKSVTIRSNGREYCENYDKLLLATGSKPLELNIPGGDDPRITHLWTIDDMDKAMRNLDAGAESAVITGAGFVGLEAAENLRARGLHVTIVQRGGHVLPALDAEMAVPIAAELAKSGIELKTGRTVASYSERDGRLYAVLDNGEELAADMAISAAGVRPNSKLAQECGLLCGDGGHITVNEYLQTSDENIFAAGDAVEVTEPLFGGRTAIPLAGPANKQGRIAAGNIAGLRVPYRGSIGSSVIKAGHLTAASVGFSEKRLREAGREYRKIYLHPSSSAGYYPGASRMHLKLLFGSDGTIYGAQIVGGKGVDKRIDSIAQAMQNGRTAPELAELELAYAPPYSSAKDPVNYAGFAAENVLSGLSDTVYPDTIPSDALVLDVREPEENELGAIPGAVNIRLGELRSRLAELPGDRLIVCCCQVGLRGYLAERILKQHGFRAANLSGGWVTWKMFHPQNPAPVAIPPPPGSPGKPAAVLDVRSLPCPGPVVKIRSSMEMLKPGETLHLLAAESFENDLVRLAESGGNSVIRLKRQENFIEADLQKGVPAATPAASAGNAGDSAAIVLFSNDFDKAMAAMILANGMAAAGMKVEIFFTFWGLSVLRRNPAPYLKKSLVRRMFGFMLPGGAEKLTLSKMNMLGLGSAMMKKVMKSQNVMSLPELIRSAREAGVRFIACDMAMGVMGIDRQELIEIDETAGVAAFAELAKRCSHTLFI